jgi:hypothetical protein
VHGLIGPFYETAPRGQPINIQRGQIYEDQPVYMPARWGLRITRVDPTDDRNVSYEITGATEDLNQLLSCVYFDTGRRDSRCARHGVTEVHVGAPSQPVSAGLVPPAAEGMAQRGSLRAPRPGSPRDGAASSPGWNQNLVHSFTAGCYCQRSSNACSRYKDVQRRGFPGQKTETSGR